jgi:hypothetical protein
MPRLSASRESCPGADASRPDFSSALQAAQGWQNKDIAVEVALDRRQVALWRQP